MVGPIAGANVADIANMASPIGCFDLGSIVRVMVNASGISTPPKKPCIARSTIICCRSWANAQATDITRNSTVFASR